LAWRSAYHAERRARRAGHTEEADDPPFDVIEYEVGKTYEGGWPRFKPGSSSVPYTPTEALKAS
jgi:hypothetical protein